MNTINNSTNPFYIVELYFTHCFPSTSTYKKREATEIQMMYIPKTFTSHSSCMYVEYAKLICFGHK